MQTQDTTITVTRLVPQTLTVPRTLTEETDPQLVDDALEAFHTLAERVAGPLSYSKATLATLATALAEGTAVCIRYEHDGEVTARVLYPSALFLTKEHHVCVRGFCTMRRAVKCFRCDRMACVHPVVFPGDIPPAPEVAATPPMESEADHWRDLAATGRDYLVADGRSFARNN